MIDAIVTAGSIPQPKEPLYALTQGGLKAMLEIAGKPMIEWVLDALCASRSVDRIIITGLPPLTDLKRSRTLTLIEDQGGIIENIRAGLLEVLRQNPTAKQALIVSSDIPAIRPEMVDWLVETTQPSDYSLTYNVIERQVMEKRFPNSRRTYFHLKNMEVCGGDMNLVSTSLAAQANPIWDSLVGSRKNPLKQATLFGYDTILLLLLRQLTLEEAEVTISKRLGINVRALPCPYAEIGMDVDKPNQYEQVKSVLAGRSGG